MLDVTIEPAPLDYGLLSDEYDAFIRDLQADGYNVGLERPYERGGGIDEEAVRAADIVIRLNQTVADGRGAAVVLGAVRKHFRARLPGSRRDGRRRIVVLGVKGETLAHVEVPEEISPPLHLSTPG
jgi:hypothetical protein